MTPEGYPDDDELKKIKEWPHDDYVGVWDFIRRRWKWTEGIREAMNMAGDKTVLVVATGGWSGNEDLIEALQENKNMIWALHWQLSARGGYFEFDLPEQVSDKEKG